MKDVADALLDIMNNAENKKLKELYEKKIPIRLDEIFEESISRKIKEQGKIKKITTRVVVDPQDVANKRYAINFFTVGHNGVYGSYVQMVALNKSHKDFKNKIFEGNVVSLIRYPIDLDKGKNEEEKQKIIQTAIEEMSSLEYINEEVIKDPVKKLKARAFRDFVP